MEKIYRFKISLKGIKPMIWRRIELKDDATFWDLNSAILDAMGWLGYHLFEFVVKEPGSGFKQFIGIPSEDFEEAIPAWEAKIRDYFTPENNKCDFTYDFGDNWQHTVKLEGIYEAENNISYPVCLAGKRACPPEDCGGTWGYSDLLATLQDPNDEEYEDTIDWLGGSFDPEQFNKAEVVFQNSTERLKALFDGFLPPEQTAPPIITEDDDVENISKNIITLKQKLKTLLKQDLVYIANKHGIVNANKIKKADLIKTLEQVIPQKFAEELIYFTREEMLIFAGNFKDLIKDLKVDNILKEMEGEGDFSIKELLDGFDFVQQNILKQNPETISNLINKGYAFPKGKYLDNGINIPEEITETYIKEAGEMGQKVMTFQTIQLYAIALTNLYGVCTYNQLHKVFKKQVDSKVSLTILKEYVIKFAERYDYFEAGENYIYTTALDEEDYEIIIQSDLKRNYYFPSEDEINAYGFGICGPEAETTFEEISQILMKKTGIVDIRTGKLIGFEEALLLESADVMGEYADILDEIIFSARMGKGLYALIEILDLTMCKANSLKDLNTLYSLYLELVEKTRKWPLKGALYSDLKR